MTFRPLHDRVLVRRWHEDEKTAGGIIIPDTAREKPMQGEIIAIGAGARDTDGNPIPLDVAIGDVVLFGKYAGNEVTIGGEELVILRETDIMGIVEDAGELKRAA